MIYYSDKYLFYVYFKTTIINNKINFRNKIDLGKVLGKYKLIVV